MFAPEPQLHACAPVFYHHAIQAWQGLGLVSAPVDHREQLDAMLLWDNPRVLPSDQHCQIVPRSHAEASATWDR